MRMISTVDSIVEGRLLGNVSSLMGGSIEVLSARLWSEELESNIAELGDMSCW